MLDNVIDYEDFAKIELKVGTIISAEALTESDKLLKLQIDLGEENPRQIIAGLKLVYEPNDLINQQVIVVANLKPRTLMNHVSEGMLLAGSDLEKLALIAPITNLKNGAKIR